MRNGVAVGLFTLVALASHADAEPMDLTDRTPRWVMITLESSPKDAPDEIDAIYSDPVPAWLEPGDTPYEVRVSVPGAIVEARVLSDQAPKPGTFSPFVWTFDTRTGEVVSAALSGVVIREAKLGFFRARVEVDIQIDMSTNRRAGYRPGHRVLGHAYAKFCDEGLDEECRLVAARRYDRDRGYVNAVGHLDVRTALVDVRSFSPLGEAIFRERIGDRSEGALSRLSLPAFSSTPVSSSPGPVAPVSMATPRP